MDEYIARMYREAAEAIEALPEGALRRLWAELMLDDADEDTYYEACLLRMRLGREIIVWEEWKEAVRRLAAELPPAQLRADLFAAALHYRGPHLRWGEQEAGYIARLRVYRARARRAVLEAGGGENYADALASCRMLRAFAG